MPKFFFDPVFIEGNYIIIIDESAYHIVNVLRVKIGEQVLLCDGNGYDYITKLNSYKISKRKGYARFETLARTESKEPSKKITLYMSVISWPNFEMAIQKCVEIGVYRIIPIITERSIYKIEDVKKKLERFNKIAKSAAEQSHRGIIPRVFPPLMFDEAVRGTKEACYVSCCERACLPLVGKVIKDELVGLWIGPEGGFSEKELDMFEKEQAVFLNLGERILRSETASIVAAAFINIAMEG